MNKGLKGTVIRVKPALVTDRLKVVATIKADTGETMEAHMPEREISALLPRSILLGSGTRAPLSLLDTVEPILSRMTEGRQVRVWQYQDRWFFSFLPWRNVRFLADTPAEAKALDGA
ncbi:MAG: hypothetical protein ABSG63_21400 [Spirochaetia bacterium]|jgi:hypothetical protein